MNFEETCPEIVVTLLMQRSSEVNNRMAYSNTPSQLHVCCGFWALRTRMTLSLFQTPTGFSDSELEV